MHRLHCIAYDAVRDNWDQVYRDGHPTFPFLDMAQRLSRALRLVVRPGVAQAVTECSLCRLFAVEAAHKTQQSGAFLRRNYHGRELFR